MSHTPGPWSYDADAEEVCGATERYAIAWIPRIVRDASDGRTLPAAERLANAHLIAAAPDLLAACQAMAHDIRATHFTDGEHRLSEDAARQMLQFLERVISKATEETNGKERSLD